MKAVVTCTENGVRFFLGVSQLPAGTMVATDMPERAHTFRDLTDAALTAAMERKHPAWKTQEWEPAYLFDDGRIALATD